MKSEFRFAVNIVCSLRFLAVAVVLWPAVGCAPSGDHHTGTVFALQPGVFVAIDAGVARGRFDFASIDIQPSGRPRNCTCEYGGSTGQIENCSVTLGDKTINPIGSGRIFIHVMGEGFVASLKSVDPSGHGAIVRP